MISKRLSSIFFLLIIASLWAPIARAQVKPVIAVSIATC